MSIGPVLDPRNHYSDVEREVESGDFDFPTNNGSGSMAAGSFERQKELGEPVEQALDVADRLAASMPVRYSHDEVFVSIREMLNGTGPQAL